MSNVLELYWKASTNYTNWFVPFCIIHADVRRFPYVKHSTVFTIVSNDSGQNVTYDIGEVHPNGIAAAYTSDELEWYTR